MIRTEDCKRAIVKWVAEHAGHVAHEFDGGDDTFGPDFEAPAREEKNWKRIEKARRGDPRAGRGWDAPTPNERVVTTCRAFDCRPYEDQLRAYVWDDGATILAVEVQGE